MPAEVPGQEGPLSGLRNSRGDPAHRHSRGPASPFQPKGIQSIVQWAGIQGGASRAPPCLSGEIRPAPSSARRGQS